MMRAGANALARRGGRQPAGFLAPGLDHAIALAAGPDRAPVLQPANPRQRKAPPAAAGQNELRPDRQRRMRVIQPQAKTRFRGAFQGPAEGKPSQVS